MIGQLIIVIAVVYIIIWYAKSTQTEIEVIFDEIARNFAKVANISTAEPRANSDGTDSNWTYSDYTRSDWEETRRPYKQKSDSDSSSMQILRKLHWVQEEQMRNYLRGRSPSSPPHHNSLNSVFDDITYLENINLDFLDEIDFLSDSEIFNDSDSDSESGNSFYLEALENFNSFDSTELNESGESSTSANAANSTRSTQTEATKATEATESTESTETTDSTESPESTKAKESSPSTEAINLEESTEAAKTTEIK